MPVPSQTRWKVLATLAALAALPFVSSGTLNYDDAWHLRWRQIIASAHGVMKVGHVRLGVTILVLEVLRRILDPNIRSFVIPARALRFSARAFPVLAMLVGIELVAVQHVDLSALGLRYVYWIVLSTEALFGFSLLCRWFSEEPAAEAGLKIGNLVFLAALPAWAAQVFQEMMRVHFFVYYENTVRATVLTLRFLTSERVTLTRGAVLNFGGGKLQILPACSGIEGATLGLLALTAFLVVFRHKLRWPLALLILPVGIFLLWLGNVARIVSLFLYGKQTNWEHTIEAFHSNIGWVLFNLILLTYLLVVARIPWLYKREARPEEPDVSWWRLPTARYLLPLILLTFFGLVSEAFNTSRIDPFYFIKILIALGSLAWLWRRTLPALEPADSELRPLLSIGVGVIVFGIWLILEIARVRYGIGVQTFSTPVANSSIVVWFAGSSVVIPIVEELAFRGYLLRRLFYGGDFHTQAYRAVSWASIGASSVAFAILHTQTVGAFLAGVGYALVCKKTNGVRGAILAHATTNLLWAFFVTVTKTWYVF